MRKNRAHSHVRRPHKHCPVVQSSDECPRSGLRTSHWQMTSRMRRARRTQNSGHNRPSAKKGQKHTTGGIPRWSPTLVLVARFSAYVWQSGRDAQFSLTYGRMYLLFKRYIISTQFCIDMRYNSDSIRSKTSARIRRSSIA